MNLFEELVCVVRELDEAGVDYALIGGLAVAVWGVPRATRDIDLLIMEDSMERAKQALTRRGFVLPAAPMRFRDGVSVERVSRVRDGHLLTVDLMVVSENLLKAWESRRRLATEEGQISVVSRDALIAMKLAAARPQDIADVDKLRDIDR